MSAGEQENGGNRSWCGGESEVSRRSTHTLHGPAVPRTSTPSADRITTHILDPPPSAQSTSGVAADAGGGVARREGMIVVYAQATGRARARAGWTRGGMKTDYGPMGFVSN